jgi:hypothetical protein
VIVQGLIHKSNHPIQLLYTPIKHDSMLLSRHQNAGQNHDVKIANRCFENVAQFIYLGMTVTNQKLIQEEIKKRLN